MAEKLTYSSSGVDVGHTDDIKRGIAGFLNVPNPRVLNGLGPFASLYDFHFPEMRHPVLVLKAEEPGSKQLLAMALGMAESVCHDMINHLVNDIAVMGARPLAVLDTIVCGSADAATVKSLVKGMADACRVNECALVGGETSVQPGVIGDGVYILTSTVAGVVEKDEIIDGSAIKKGDAVIAVASNGLHTNGYTLVRKLLEMRPGIADEDVNGETFMDAIMRPHAPYYCAVKGLFSSGKLRAMAHITGGGIQGNLNRVMPAGLGAHVELGRIKVLPLFKKIKEAGNVEDGEMLRTFNCGVGLVIVADKSDAQSVIDHLSPHYDAYVIGEITDGDRDVRYSGSLKWE